MPAPPSSKQTAAKNAATAARQGLNSGNSGNKGTATASKSTGSGAIGSKGGGASTQKPGAGTKAKAGAQAGKVTQSNLKQAKQSLSKNQSTALGKAAESARQNAARPSGTATQFGGKQLSPGKIYSNAGRSSSALNSVLNNNRLMGLNNRQAIDAVARNMGLKNPAGRAGMIGTFDHESAGLNPNALGDKGTAFGLGQWRGDRRTALGNYATGMGQPLSNPGLQTAFGITEMGRAYPKTLAGLQNASNVRQAVAAMNDYERPRGWTPGGNPANVAGWNDRVARSNNALASFGQPVGQPPSNNALAGRNWDNVLNTPYNTVFPERAPVTGTAQSFPGRPRNNGARLHAGLDFGVEPNGAPVTPVVPGKVVQVAKSKGAYGPTVQVMNTYGVIDRYALHKDQSIPVKVGQPVYPGTVLGTAGKLPGNPNNFSHLHYERITAKDPAHRSVVAGMKDGSLANTTGRVVGSTTSPAIAGGAIRSSTPQWARSMGLGQGENVQRGAGLQGPSAPTQIASSNPNAVAEAARIQRRDAALQTLAGGSTPPAPRPQARPFSTGPWQGPRMPSVGAMGDDAFAQPFRPQAPTAGRGTTVPTAPPRPPTAGRGAITPTYMATPNLTAGRSAVNPTYMAAPGLTVGRSAVTPAYPATPNLTAGRGAVTPTYMKTPNLTSGRSAVAPFAPPRAPTAGRSEVVPTAPPASPLGNVPPAAKQPRLTMPAGTYTAPYDRPVGDPQANLGFTGMPPMGGAIPPDMAKAFGEWGITRTPPAAPHLGTPGSQTAEIQDDAKKSVWEQGGDWIKTKVEEAKPVVEQISEGQKKVAEAQANPVKNFLLNLYLGTGGGTPQSARDRYLATVTPGRGKPFERQARSPLPLPTPSAPPPQAQSVDAFMQQLRTAGATPEEIAYILQLIEQQPTRA